MKITPLGDSALLAYADPQEKSSLLAWARALRGAALPGLVDIVVSYDSLAVFYDAIRLARQGAADSFAQVSQHLREAAEKATDTAEPTPAEKVIPVWYGGEAGPDLADVAARAGLSIEAVIGLHTSAHYEVKAIGFSPGFPYLSGLPEALHSPRRSTPRTLVPAGSVGIGGAQTGVYPIATPGGWNLIGRTPLRLFRPENNRPAFLAVGDQVRFEPISERDFIDWKS
jgi:inhibitor of KinA